jgi:hypothetical protein
VLISVKGTGKNQLKAGQKSMGDAPVSSHCSLLQNPSPKPTSVLKHCCEGETMFWFSIFWAFPSDCIPQSTNDVNVHFFIHIVPHAANPVNYSSEFQELFEATMYIADRTPF